MKKMLTLAIVLTLSGLFSFTVFAGEKAAAPADQGQEKVQTKEEKAASEALQAQEDYRQKREAMKARRDAAIELRNRNIRTNNPGNTGM